MKSVKYIVLLLLLLSSVLALFGCNTRRTTAINVEPYIPSAEPSCEEQTTTEEPTTEEPTTEEPTTEEPTTTEPPTTEPPTTAPPEPPKDPNELIGTLYTRAQLMAMDNSRQGAGFGGGKDEFNRPYLSLRQQEAFGKYGARFIVPEKTDTIYLTFDLGYEWHNNTTKILDILAANNVKGTFFPTLNYVKRNPAIIQRIIDEGHTLGSHTSTHPVLPSISIDEMYTQLMDVNNYVLEHYNYQITTLRPPTGAYSIRTVCMTKSLGMDSIFWSYSYKDWDTTAQPDPATSLNNAIKAAHPGAIYLLHSVSDTNTLILDDLIKELKKTYILDQL